MYTSVIATVFTFVLKFRFCCGKVTIILCKIYYSFILTVSLAFQGIFWVPCVKRKVYHWYLVKNLTVVAILLRNTVFVIPGF